MSDLRRIPGWGLMSESCACNCKACYASSIGSSPESIHNWVGSDKCVLDKPAQEISPEVRRQMLLFLQAVRIMQHEREEGKN